MPAIKSNVATASDAFRANAERMQALVADLTPIALQGTAFGWYNAVLGIGALGASVGFGVIWETFGPRAAFLTGAALALVAAGALLAARLPERGRTDVEQRPMPERVRTSLDTDKAF